MNLENCSNFEIVLEASCVCESDRAQPGGITWVWTWYEGWDTSTGTKSVFYTITRVFPTSAYLIKCIVQHFGRHIPLRANLQVALLIQARCGRRRLDITCPIGANRQTQISNTTLAIWFNQDILRFYVTMGNGMFARCANDLLMDVFEAVHSWIIRYESNNTKIDVSPVEIILTASSGVTVRWLR